MGWQIESDTTKRPPLSLSQYYNKSSNWPRLKCIEYFSVTWKPCPSWTCEKELLWSLMWVCTNDSRAEWRQKVICCHCIPWTSCKHFPHTLEWEYTCQGSTLSWLGVNVTRVLDTWILLLSKSHWSVGNLFPSLSLGYLTLGHLQVHFTCLHILCQNLPNWPSTALVSGHR